MWNMLHISRLEIGRCYDGARLIVLKQNKHLYANITLRDVVRRTTSKSATSKKQIASGTSAITSSSVAAKKHFKWIILSLAEATVADGGGFSAAIVMAQKASGLSVEDVAYSVSLGLLPLCVGNTAMGRLMEDDTVDKGISDNKEIMDEWKLKSSGRVYWPGSLAFAALQCLLQDRGQAWSSICLWDYRIHYLMGRSLMQVM